MLAVERIFEENMRVMGDSTESAYSHPSIVSNVKRDADDADKKRNNWSTVQRRFLKSV